VDAENRVGHIVTAKSLRTRRFSIRQGFFESTQPNLPSRKAAYPFSGPGMDNLGLGPVLLAIPMFRPDCCHRVPDAGRGSHSRGSVPNYIIPSSLIIFHKKSLISMLSGIPSHCIYELFAKIVFPTNTTKTAEYTAMTPTTS
jgi:hypothetical protein